MYYVDAYPFSGMCCDVKSEYFMLNQSTANICWYVTCNCLGKVRIFIVE